MTTRIIPPLSVLYVLLTIACHNTKSPDTSKPTARADSLTGKPLPVSVVDSTSSAFIDTSLDRFAFIANDQYIILSASPDSNLAKGAPYHTEEENGTYSSITDVNTAALPANYKELLNKKYKVGSTTGAVYTVTITDFKLFATTIPHFGRVQDWNQLATADADKIKARDIRDEGALYLAATFTIDNQASDTGNLYFAVPVAQPTPAFFTPADKNTAATYKVAITPLLGKTKDYLSVQKKYAASMQGIWWQDKEGYESVDAFSLNDQKTYITICHQAGNACSSDEFFAERFSIWEVPKNGTPSLLYLKDGYYNLLLAVDIDADNIPELLVNSGFGKTELLKYSNGQWTEYYTWIVPYHDCPC